MYAVLRLILVFPAVLPGAYCFAEPSTASISATKCDPPPASLTNFGTVVADGVQLTPSHNLPLPSANALRYRRFLIANNSKGSTWSIRIYDSAGRPLQAIDSQMMDGVDEFWTRRIPQSNIVFQTDYPSHNANLQLVEHVEMPLAGSHQYYSTKTRGSPDWRSLYGGTSSSLQLRVGETVGMMFATMGSSSTGYSTWSCSGFMVSNAGTSDKNAIIFVTAAHCGSPEVYKNLAWSDIMLRRSFIDLSWDGDDVSREYRIKSARFRDELDLAALTIESIDNDSAPKPVSLRDAPPIPGEPLFMIHHPISEEKQISDFSCSVKELRLTGASTRFTHQCDAESGSSGAPLFDTLGVVVGMHLEGFELSASGICDKVNKAISSQAILRFLQDVTIDNTPHP